MGCLNTLMKHVSIRNYRDEPISTEDLEKILEAARRAPTAWNLMPIHVSAILDNELKKKAAEAVGGQDHVARSAVFLVFSIDYDKILEAVKKKNIEPAPKGLLHLIEALLAAGLMSAWAGIAAESLGYGITYIAAYADPCALAEALGLPKELIPVIGITIGKPAEKPNIRPRQDRVYSIDNKVPQLGERAESVLRLYGERAERLFKMVLSREGYAVEDEARIRECLRSRGYFI